MLSHQTFGRANTESSKSVSCSIHALSKQLSTLPKDASNIVLSSRVLSCIRLIGTRDEQQGRVISRDVQRSEAHYGIL